MNFFKPAEIRAILILSILVLIGSALTLLKRQGKLSGLDLDMFLEDGRYNYSYKADDVIRQKAEEKDKIEAGDYSDAQEVSTDDIILNINSAGYYDFQSLPGIGPVLAERIIAYRDSVGAFKSVDELSNVKGIGEKKLAGLKDRIAVE